MPSCSLASLHFKQLVVDRFILTGRGQELLRSVELIYATSDILLLPLAAYLISLGLTWIEVWSWCRRESYLSSIDRRRNTMPGFIHHVEASSSHSRQLDTIRKQR